MDKPIALGDQVNSRHPRLGNGTLGIFKNIENIVQYIERREKLASAIGDPSSAQDLAKKISQQRHQIDNMPEFLKSMRQHLDYLESVEKQTPYLHGRSHRFSQYLKSDVWINPHFACQALDLK